MSGERLRHLDNDLKFLAEYGADDCRDITPKNDDDCSRCGELVQKTHKKIIIEQLGDFYVCQDCYSKLLANLYRFGYLLDDGEKNNASR